MKIERKRGNKAGKREKGKIREENDKEREIGEIETEKDAKERERETTKK